jgi:hypothetical protein
VPAWIEDALGEIREVTIYAFFVIVLRRFHFGRKSRRKEGNRHLLLGWGGVVCCLVGWGPEPGRSCESFLIGCRRTTLTSCCGMSLAHLSIYPAFLL